MGGFPGLKDLSCSVTYGSASNLRPEVGHLQFLEINDSQRVAIPEMPLLEAMAVYTSSHHLTRGTAMSHEVAYIGDESEMEDDPTDLVTGTPIPSRPLEQLQKAPRLVVVEWRSNAGVVDPHPRGVDPKE